MVCIETGKREIVLFHAGESLMGQLMDCKYLQERFVLIAAFSVSKATVETAIDHNACVVIDATNCPGPAAEVLENIAARNKHQAVTVYTETMHEGLELFTRLRGAWLILGPMNDQEWAGFFRSIGRTVAHSRRNCG